MLGRTAFLGVDCSSTGTGAVLLDIDGAVLGSWVWQHSGEPSARLHSLGRWADEVNRSVQESTGDAVLALSIEAPFVRGLGTRVLLRAQGAVMSRFEGTWETYAPQEVKALAKSVTPPEVTVWSGSKYDMAAAAERRLGSAATTRVWVVTEADDRMKAIGDLADAYWVAELDRLTTLQAAGVSDG